MIEYPTNCIVESDVTNLYEPYLIIFALHIFFFTHFQLHFFSLFSCAVLPTYFMYCNIVWVFDLMPSLFPTLPFFFFVHCYTQTDANVHNHGFFS